MTLIQKDSVVMAARNENQLAAFLNNGWKIKGDEPNKTEVKPVLEEVGEKKTEDFSQFMNPPEEAEQEVKTYTKTEINRLNKEQLINLATENGIENASEMSGNELKARLIEILIGGAE